MKSCKHLYKCQILEDWLFGVKVKGNGLHVVWLETLFWQILELGMVKTCAFVLIEKSFSHYSIALDVGLCTEYREVYVLRHGNFLSEVMWYYNLL